jgi:hypothetical protein
MIGNMGGGTQKRKESRIRMMKNWMRSRKMIIIMEQDMLLGHQ